MTESKLERAGVPIPRQPKRACPVWQGPESDGPQGGITFSLLSRFLVCRERFRLLVVEGLRGKEGFNHRLEYGNLWHVCEQAIAKGDDPTRGGRADRKMPLWLEDLGQYVVDLLVRYPLQREQVTHWYNVCKVQFPLCLKFWASREGSQPELMRPLLSEQLFSVPYTLPSGRTVYLRGKWDSVWLRGRGKNAGIWLQENKTKGDVREGQIVRQLRFDLQTMLYLVALNEYLSTNQRSSSEMWVRRPVRGVLYNVVRRPLSGGKGTIVRHKATKNKREETAEEFYSRLAAYISKEPETYFMRWDVGVSPEDVSKFRRQCLDPILEQLCDWWEAMEQCNFSPWSEGGIINHWRHPFGVWNPLDEGGSSDLDAYLDGQGEVGLERMTNLFPELG
jgi:hypothetical protein